MNRNISTLGSILLLLLLAAWIGHAWQTSLVRADDNAPRTDNAPQAGVLHSVYFALKDQSEEARKRLVDACKKYLSDHPGAKSFSAGVRAADLDRSVNDTDFDVALYLQFETKAAYDKYQTAEKHLKFIEENRDNWKNVRVFDAYVAP